jgi:hypothetical protein
VQARNGRRKRTKSGAQPRQHFPCYAAAVPGLGRQSMAGLAALGGVGGQDRREGRRVAFIRRAAEGGQVVRHTVTARRDGSAVETKQYARGEWTAAAWWLERRRPEDWSLMREEIRRLAREVAARGPDGGGAVQLHVHVPAPWRRAVGVPAGRADATADDASRAAWWPATRPLAGSAPGQPAHAASVYERKAAACCSPRFLTSAVLSSPQTGGHWPGAIAGVKCNRHVLGSGRTQVERRNSRGAAAARRAGLFLS